MMSNPSSRTTLFVPVINSQLHMIFLTFFFGCYSSRSFTSSFSLPFKGRKVQHRIVVSTGISRGDECNDGTKRKRVLPIIRSSYTSSFFYGCSPISQSSLFEKDIKTLYDLKNLDNDRYGHGPDNDRETSIISNSDLCLDSDSALQGLVSHAPESFYLIDKSIRSFADALLPALSSLAATNQTSDKEGNILSNANTVVGLEMVIQGDENIGRSLNDLSSLTQFLVKPRYSIHLNISSSNRNRRDELRENILELCWSTHMDLKEGHDDKIKYCFHSQPTKCDDETPTLTQHYFQLSEKTSSTSVELHHSRTCLELSHDVLKNSIECSHQTQTILDEEKLKFLLSQMEKRLILTMGSDLRGRTSADAAFNLALAGVEDSIYLFDSLISIALHEIQRIGQRSSFKPKYVLQMIEKFAVSGASRSTLLPLYRAAANTLTQKKYKDVELIESLSKGNFGLHSDRPLLWLWRFSTRQKKISPPTKSDLPRGYKKTSIDWNDVFDTPDASMIIDIGCGMGVSLLNAATYSRDENFHDEIIDATKDIQWQLSNYAGTDLNQMMVRYANSIASRLDGKKNLKFFNLPAEEFLSEILSTYKGQISLVLLQFPSPYRLDTANNFVGNTQLPPSAREGFMVTDALLNQIAKVLELNGGCGKVLFQTKCEDVAVYVKNLAIGTGKLESISCDNPVLDIDRVYLQAPGGRPNRVEQWLSSVPNSDTEPERAEGSIWSSSKLIPSFGRSETEVACQDNGTFLHRCMFKNT